MDPPLEEEYCSFQGPTSAVCNLPLFRQQCRPPVKASQLMCYSTCISFAFLLATVAIGLNGASVDCLLSNSVGLNGNSPQPASLASDRIVIVKTPVLNLPGSNHRKPKIINDTLTVKVKENTPLNSKIIDIQLPDDPDIYLQTKESIYSIVGGADYESFELYRYGNKVELVNLVSFDYESPKKSYNVVVRATSINLFYEVDIEIIVQDENDNRPQLEDFYIIFNNYKNHMPTGPIGRVPATDADINDQLHYKITSGNNAELILVNETTGDIQLSPWLNGTTPIRHVFDVLVSDGSNEVTAQLVFTSNLVTEAMLQNSVLLRLDGIGREEFLSQKYDLFLSSMARILGTYSPSDLVIFNVEESIQLQQPSGSPHEAAPAGFSSAYHRSYHHPNLSNLSQSVNVSFSVRKNKGDVESYYSNHYLEERIHLNRFNLMQALRDVVVAPFADNPCLLEPCQNYQECLPVYTLDKAPKSFISTRNMLFRTIKMKQGYTCVCPATFTGMKHKAECNVQINQCFSNPCENGGVCHQHESGYSCECKADFLGPKCEHSFSNSTCQSIAVHPNPMSLPLSSSLLAHQSSQLAAEDRQTLCSGKSVCVDSSRAFSSQVTASSRGFRCEGCPHPAQWTNRLCQLRARSFNKNSYITLPSLRRRHRFHLMLQFATIQTDALILYNGRFNDRNDFIALEIVDSYVRFSWSLGSSVNSLVLTSVPVTNGDWHKIAVDYRDRNVTILLDDCDPVIDEALSARMQSSRRCSNTSYFDPASNLLENRMLDLSSPMHLGSLPSLQSDIQKSPALAFVGCINDLYIDHQLVDLNTPLYNFNTQPGCPEKPNFCQLHSCNGHACQEFWGAAKCLCGDDYLGKSCETSISPEKVRKFTGNSYLSFSPIESTVASTWQISLHFRTINPNGILLKVYLDPDASVLLELHNGGLRLTGQRSSNLSLHRVALDDGEWHYVEVVWLPNYTRLQVDYNPHLSVQGSDMGNFAGSIIKTVTVGAAQPAASAQPGAGQEPLPGGPSGALLSADFSSSSPGDEFAAASGANLPGAGNQSSAGSQSSFVGCIYGVNVSSDNNLELWLAAGDERNVERGCQVPDICETSSCPANSRCLRRGMNQSKCVCNPGFLGDRCLPVCELRPCQGELSKCHPVLADGSPAPGSDSALQAAPAGGYTSPSQQQQQQPDTSGWSGQSSYRCECESLRSGRNCEHQLTPRCPSNWWGKPVVAAAAAAAGAPAYPQAGFCGPCACDESKGLDGDCDKTTGRCFCKANHYQPEASDTCLPCDCYNVGSLSPSCNHTTGQCKCRAGAVGRRCDACASSRAEVTLYGCEVIYSECPKTFSDGIWWERTPLGRLAVQQCPPSTSTGNATRFCDSAERWKEPDTFNCLSNQFTELYKYDQFFQDNKFPNIKPNVAAEIASNLRYSLNQTLSNPALQLYGSDIYLSFRLIHHLLQHEIRQAAGLNLTHRQDRLYIRNMVESISYILDPFYANSWSKIAEISPLGGAEHLLRLLDGYGRVLIESQADVVTQPFEVWSKYLTFGMDTLSSGQSLDLAKSPALQTPYPPYATEPAGQLFLPPLGDLGAAGAAGNETPASAGYLDYTLQGKEASPAMVIPKYDNYAPHPDKQDAITKVLVPLKTLKIKTIQELLPISYYPGSASASASTSTSSGNGGGVGVKSAMGRAKREDLIIPEIVSKLSRQQPAMVVYSIFASLGPLLPSYHDNSVQSRFGMTAGANSPVVWLTLKPANSSEFLHRNIQPKINYVLKMVEPIGKTRPQCAVWSFLASAGSGAPLGNRSSAVGLSDYPRHQHHHGTGRFSTRGCELKGIHPNHRLRYKYDYVNCSCDHLGAVTVLMDTANYDYLSSEEASGKDTSIVLGFAISMVILLLLLFVLTCVRSHSIKSNSNSINKNLVFILLVMETLILYTMASRSSLNQHEYQCKLAAIFLHYFSISLFFWLLINAVHFYRMLTELRDINHGPMKFYHAFGYAFPAFFVSIAVGLRMEHFGNYLFCWLSIHEPIIWSMFGPISFVSAIIILLFLLAVCPARYKSLGLDDELDGAQLLKEHMLINLIKTPLIGLHWITTVYVVNEALNDYVFLYPALTVAKSLLLFLMLCLVDKHIRYNLYVSWLRLRGQKVPLMEEALNYGTSGARPMSNHFQQQWSTVASVLASDPMAALSHHKHYASYARATGYHHHASAQPLTPGFQGSSCTDIFRPDVLAFSAASTTSRSSATGTSESAYQQYQQRGGARAGRAGQPPPPPDSLDAAGQVYGARSRHRSRRHKKSHRHHRSHHHHHHHHHHHAGARSQKSRGGQAAAAAADEHYGQTTSGLAVRHRRPAGQPQQPQQQQQQQHHHHHQHQEALSRSSLDQLTTAAAASSRDERGLASSHSSDDDDDEMSTLPKRASNLTSGPAMEVKLADENSSLTADKQQQQQQTLPMELTTTGSTAQQQQPQSSSLAGSCSQTETVKEMGEENKDN